MHRCGPGFTVEGYLDGVSDFADSANRAQGGRRLGAFVLVLLLLLVAVYLIMDAVGFVFSAWFSSSAASQDTHVTNSFDTRAASGISVEA
jgi:flagellar basal body-associated protein FliL